jgi:hypothetical protein
MLAVRLPDRTALNRTFNAAKRAGASGVILFRLPDDADASGWSLRQTGALAKIEKPNLVLRMIADGKISLSNESHTDLPPRFYENASDQTRGYALEIDASSPVWREALEGDFWHVASRSDSNAEVPIPLAPRIVFLFSHLRAGGSLTSGLIQLAPGARTEEFRWRVRDSETAGEWRKIESAVTE